MLYGQCSLKLDVLLDKKNIILTMRRYLFSFILTVIFCVSVTAQKKYSVYGIGFYNQENLFDYTGFESLFLQFQERMYAVHPVCQSYQGLAIFAVRYCPAI